jgi:hypothetical protein
VTIDGFGLVNRLIDHLYTAHGTTSNYNTIVYFHTSNHSTLSLLSLLSPVVAVTALNNAYSFRNVFTGRFLVTTLKKEDFSAFVLTSLLSGEYPTTELST